MRTLRKGFVLSLALLTLTRCAHFLDAEKTEDAAKIHLQVAIDRFNSREYNKAVEACQKAISVDPKMPEARLRLAEALRATGQLQASLIQYETAVSIDPAVVEAWVGGAEALIGLGLNQQASEWLVRARRLHPNQPALAALQAKLLPVKR